MSVTINGLQIKNLTAQPFGYEADDVRLGLVARNWTVSGLLDATQLGQFKSIFDNWWAARQGDGDSIATNSVGSTVSLSASANGLSASGVACWFTEAPSFEQLGAYVQVSATLVDANQALTAAKKALEKSAAADLGLAPDLGTVTLGGVVITLTEPMETLDDLPTLERTAGGFPYIQGPLRSSRVRTISGTVANEAAFTTLRNWVATTVQSTPATGDWWPISAPTANAETRIVSGLKTTIWTVSISVEQV
jgi:hypothetical protein